MLNVQNKIKSVVDNNVKQDASVNVAPVKKKVNPIAMINNTNQMIGESSKMVLKDSIKNTDYNMVLKHGAAPMNHGYRSQNNDGTAVKKFNVGDNVWYDYQLKLKFEAKIMSIQPPNEYWICLNLSNQMLLRRARFLTKKDD